MRDKIALFFKWIRVVYRQLYNSWLNFKEDHEYKIQRAKMHGDVLKGLEKTRKSAQDRCNHRKGGMIGDYSNGDGWFRSVIKHTHHWGDTWVRCTRCGKSWKPGDPDYEEALDFKTDNRPSSSILFYGDNVRDKGREATRDTT